MTRIFHYFALVVLLNLVITVGHTQCNPISFTGLTSVVESNERCLGGGQIRVTSTSPDTGSYGVGEYNEYRLVLSSDSSEVKGWQRSPFFSGNITAGNYLVQVKKICSGSSSNEYTQVSVNTILNEYNPAFINGATIVQAICGNDGKATINAIGRAPLTYALIDANNTPINPATTNNVFENLAVGAYRVRVWDSCGGFATYSFNITQLSNSTPEIIVPSFYKYGCDSFTYTFVLQNYVNYNRQLAKVWIVWPSGDIDSLPAPIGNDSFYTLPFNLNKLTNSYNPAVSFLQNIAATSKTFTVNYKTACGVVTAIPTSIRPLALQTILNTLPSRSCDSIRYSVTIYYSASSGATPAFNYSFGTRNYIDPNAYFSIDNGVTWHQAITSGYAENLVISLGRGTTYDFKYASCGDTLTRQISPETLAGLGAPTIRTVFGSNNGCSTGSLEVGTNLSNALGDSVYYEIISATPAWGGPFPPAVKVRRNVTSSLFTNLPYGNYQIKITDSVGLSCSRSLTVNVSLTRNAFTPELKVSNLMACNGNSGFSLFNPIGTGADNRNVTVRVLSQPNSNPLPALMNFQIYTNTFNSDQFISEFYNLPLGYYELEFADTVGLPASCHRIATASITLTQADAIQGVIELSSACNGALTITYQDSLYNRGVPYLNTPINLSNGLQHTVSIYNSSNVLMITPFVGTTPGNGRIIEFSPSAAITNAWPDGDYRIVITRKNNLSQTAPCAVETIWSKNPTRINPSPTIFINGCGGVAGDAIIVGAATGSNARPFTWTLYEVGNPTAIAGPTTNNIFPGLNSGTQYRLEVLDTCGTSQPYITSIAASLRVFASNATNTQCDGDNVLFNATKVPGASYQWYKDSVAIPGATADAYELFNIQNPADAGSYYVIVNASASCDLYSEAFDLDIDCGALPIQLGDFNAKVNGNYVILDWMTYSERNNKGFFVQKSNDGTVWDNIGFVSSLSKDGNSSSNLMYNFVDEKPNEGKNFYRLKQQDMNGEFDYSAIKLINFNALYANRTSIYPNPAASNVTISGLQEGELVTIYDVMGRVIISQKAAKKSIVVSLDKFTSGTYRVQIKGQMELQSHTLVVTK